MLYTGAMQWISLFFAVISSALATTAVVICIRMKRSAIATHATIAREIGKLQETEATVRSIVTSHAELAVVRDEIAKAEDLLKRVNQREVMRARRSGVLDFGTTKDDLRRAAGLVAGKPAPHR